MDGDKNKGGGGKLMAEKSLIKGNRIKLGGRVKVPPILFVFLSLFYFHFHPLFRVLSISPSLSLLGLGGGGS